MKKTATQILQDETPLEGLLLEYKIDRYKLAYAALRWAKEIKQKESLPDPIPVILPRALREILAGKAHIKDIEKLAMIIKVATPPPAPAAPVSHPTITLNIKEDTPSSKDGKDDEAEDEE